MRYAVPPIQHNNGDHKTKGVFLKLVRILMRARSSGERWTKAESKFQGRCCVREQSTRGDLFILIGGRLAGPPDDRGTHAGTDAARARASVVRESCFLLPPRNAICRPEPEALVTAPVDPSQNMYSSMKIINF